MIEREITYASLKKGIIHAAMWEPEKGKIKAVIQISHGVTEYAWRYKDFAEYFTSKGFVVVVNDHLGHGKSFENADEQMYADKESLVSDMNQMFEIAKEKYPNVPYFVIGFSLGSFVTREFLCKQKEGIDGVILMGTGYQPYFVTKAMRVFLKMEANKSGVKAAPIVVQNLAFGTYNKQVKNPETDFDWLIANPQTRKEYMNDELAGKFITTGMFLAMIEAIEYSCMRKNVRKMKKTLPVLLMSGSEDPVGDNKKGVLKVQKLFESVGIKDVETFFYPESRHDILHEKVREKVCEDICTWILSKM